MRICPKCGYEDPPQWKQSMHFHEDYMPFTDFEMFYPKLAILVLKQKYVEDKPFVYHLTKGRNVLRQAIIDNPTYFVRWHPNYERVHHGCKSDTISKGASTRGRQLTALRLKRQKQLLEDKK